MANGRVVTSCFAAWIGCAALGCQEELSDQPSGGIRSGGGVGQTPAGAGSAAGGAGEGGGVGGAGDPAPEYLYSASLQGDELTLVRESDVDRVEAVIPAVSGDLKGTYRLSGAAGGARATLTVVATPLQVYRSKAGRIVLGGCGVNGRAAVLTGTWDGVVLSDVSGDGERRLDGPFSFPAAALPCEAPAGEGEGEGEAGDPPPECELTADDLCRAQGGGLCCPFRRQVEDCHLECSFGLCLDPQADTCLPCLEGCIRNIVDAACEDRYIPLARCEFDSECVGANDSALTCTIKQCCEELGGALTGD